MTGTMLRASSPTTTSASTTVYLTAANAGATTNGTENNRDYNIRRSGTFSHLGIRISANATSASSTLRFRKNAANGNQVVSIAAGATGFFEDTSNTDSVTAGDEVAYQLVTAAGGGISYRVLQSVFTAGSGEYEPIMLVGSAGFATASTSYYGALGGFLTGMQNVTTEAQGQTLVRAAGTLRHLYVRVQTNTRASSATTIRSRVNNANGTLEVSVPASTAGVFEATVNSDTIASGDLVGWQAVTGTGTGTLTALIIGGAFEPSAGPRLLVAHDPGGESFGTASTPFYSPLAGDLFQESTESLVSSPWSIPARLSRFSLYVLTNPRTTSSTGRLRKNAADTTVTFSIPSSTTGWFEDATNHADVAVGDETCMSMTLGTGTGTMVWTSMVTVQDVAPVVTVTGSQASTTATASAGAPAVAPQGVQAVETDTAAAGTPAVAVQGVQAVETDTGLAGLFDVAYPGVQAAETDSASAGAVTAAAAVQGVQAVETDTAAAGTPAVAVQGVQASETDVGQAGSLTVGVSAQGVQAVETDTAAAGAPAVAAQGVQAVETDTAAAGSSFSGVSAQGTQAVETDTGLTGAPAVAAAGVQAVETDTGQPGAPAIAAQGAQASELDAAAAGAPAVAAAGVQAVETDTGLAGTARADIAAQGVQAVEVDTGHAGGPGVAYPGTQAVETDEAHAGTHDVGAPPEVSAVRVTHAVDRMRVTHNVDSVRITHAVDVIIDVD